MAVKQVMQDEIGIEVVWQYIYLQLNNEINICFYIKHQPAILSDETSKQLTSYIAIATDQLFNFGNQRK